MMNRTAVLGFVLFSAATPLYAQAGRPTSSSGNGPLPLPAGVSQLVSDDALNQLIVVMETTDEPAPRYAIIRPRHVYSGGIAVLFGAPVIPTLARVNSIAGGGAAGAGGMFGFGAPGAGAALGGSGGFGGGIGNGGLGGNGFGSGGFGGNGLGAGGGLSGLLGGGPLLANGSLLGGGYGSFAGAGQRNSGRRAARK